MPSLDLGEPQPLTRAKAAKRLSKFLADTEATQGLPLSVIHHLQTLEAAISAPAPKHAKAAHEGGEGGAANGHDA